MNLADLDTLNHSFMVNAICAGLMVSVCAGLMGYFVILRNYTFASHALGHIGIPGATGAVLLGISPLFGLFAFCIVGAVLIAGFGNRISNREIATGTILALAMGVGLWFSRASGAAGKTLQSVLFGNILGIKSAELLSFGVVTLVVVVITLIIYRPLLLSSLSPEIALTKGVKVSTLNILFILMLALVTAVSIQVVGSLLLFALLITPASAALNLFARPLAVSLFSILFGALSVGLGIVTSVLVDIPPSFAIVLFSTLIWLISLIKVRK